MYDLFRLSFLKKSQSGTEQTWHVQCIYKSRTMAWSACFTLKSHFIARDSASCPDALNLCKWIIVATAKSIISHVVYIISCILKDWSLCVICSNVDNIKPTTVKPSPTHLHCILSRVWGELVVQWASLWPTQTPPTGHTSAQPPHSRQLLQSIELKRRRSGAVWVAVRSRPEAASQGLHMRKLHLYISYLKNGLSSTFCSSHTIARYQWSFPNRCCLLLNLSWQRIGAHLYLINLWGKWHRRTDSGSIRSPTTGSCSPRHVFSLKMEEIFWFAKQ